MVLQFAAKNGDFNDDISTQSQLLHFWAIDELTTAVCPDVEMKDRQKFSHICPKSGHSYFRLKSDVFKKSPFIWATFKRKFDTKMFK